MRPYHILDEHHNVVPVDDVLTWAEWYENADRTVAFTIVNFGLSHECRVSTVFLGINHNWNPSGRLLIFETMVFDGPLDGDMDRYSTWDEAVLGHEILVERVRNAIAAEI